MSSFRRALDYIHHGIRPVCVKADISYTSPGALLQGKRIVVTGASRGIGKALARKFISHGAKVLITARNDDSLRATALELGCLYKRLDIADFRSFDTFVKEAADSLGGIDCLVNNAGISLHEPSFFDVTADSFTSQVNTNLIGPFLLTQKIVPLFQKKGSILFMSSETGEMADIRPYGLTKAAVNSLVKGLAALFAMESIRVNAIAPGVTATDMTGVDSDNLNLSYNLCGRAYLPEEIAEAATFILSDISGSISGQILTCNNANSVNPRWKQA